MQAAARGLIARRGIELVFEMHEWAAVAIQAAARGHAVRRTLVPSGFDDPDGPVSDGLDSDDSLSYDDDDDDFGALPSSFGAMPPYMYPWIWAVDEESGDVYYYNTETQEASWDLPAAPPPRAEQPLQPSAARAAEAANAKAEKAKKAAAEAAATVAGLLPAVARIQAAARRRAARPTKLVVSELHLTITESAGGVLLELHDINKAFPAVAGPTEESTPSFGQTRHAGREGTGLISTDGPEAQGAAGGVLLEPHDINKAFPAVAGPTEESTPSFGQTRHAGREGTGLISTDGPEAQGPSAEEMEAAARAAAVAAAVAARQRALTLIQGVARGRIVRGPLAADPRAARSVDVSRHVPGADGGG